MEMMMPSTNGTCETGKGYLPGCAPLANPYVPFQASNPEVYQAPTGFVRGTMFPGLDLPFRGLQNTTEKTDTPLHQLQMLGFAITELGLYLDTHSSDQDATDLFNQYVEQYADAMRQYEQRYGALTQMDSALSGKYEWLSDPWPWEYQSSQEG